MCGYPWMPDEFTPPPRAGVTGTCEPFNIGPGNWIWVL